MPPDNPGSLNVHRSSGQIEQWNFSHSRVLPSRVRGTARLARGFSALAVSPGHRNQTTMTLEAAHSDRARPRSRALGTSLAPQKAVELVALARFSVRCRNRGELASLCGRD